MTQTPLSTSGDGDRFRLHRAGILNVWQYDDQEFLFAGGRMLLRGANGAGKSKTLEMLLPFALDGDKARITASAKHHTSLLWLMTDGYDGQARVGYLWVEFQRTNDQGHPESFSCGVGVRASASARTATSWFFTTRQQIGSELALEDAGGPLSRPRLEEAIGAEGQVFQQAAAYKEHVGRALFGLALPQYDEVLRLLYWLRQPQIGEDIEPSRLAGQLAQALPQLDAQAVKAAGDTFDELTAFGEQIARRTAAAEALDSLASAYARYARSSVAGRARAVLDLVREERGLRAALRRRERDLRVLGERREETETAQEQVNRALSSDLGRIRELEASPEARDQRRLGDLGQLSADQEELARGAAERVDRSQEAHDRRLTHHARSTEAVLRRVRDHAQSRREIDTRQRDAGLETTSAESTVLDTDHLEAGEQVDRIGVALAASRAWAIDVAAQVSRRRAAVVVVREALHQLDAARRDLTEEERGAAEAERRWENAQMRRVEAEEDSESRATELWTSLTAWAAEPIAPELALPDDLTTDSVSELPRLAREAAAPTLSNLRARSQTAATARDNSRERIAGLVRQRTQIAGESDPAPDPPALTRTPRPDGAPLWRLVDFADHLDDRERAGLEAALQAAGLLDSWIRPGGGLLDAQMRDVVLLPGAALEGPSLRDALRPDVPTDSDVAETVVDGVLRRVRLGLLDDEVAAVDVDGSWRLAPLRGSATKQRAQYVGATARAQERQRRLDEVDRLLDAARQILDDSAEQVSTLTGTIEAVEDWLRRRPAAESLLAAWTRVTERRTIEVADEIANALAQQTVHRAREHAARAGEELDQLVRQHDVPADPGRLAALDERLRELGQDLRAFGDGTGSIVRDLERWTSDQAALAEEAASLALDRATSARLNAEAQDALARLSELRENVGASVRQLEERLGVLREAVRASRADEERLGTVLRGLDRQTGSAETATEQARVDLTEHQHGRSTTLGAFAAVAEVPGLLASAVSTGPPMELSAAQGRSALLGAPAVPADEALPDALVSTAELLAGLADPGDEADVNVVWRAYNDAASGPAADHEPTVAEYADLVAVTGRDDAGDSPVGLLAARVAAAVTRDRELLTERERERFEQHVLGELGDTIRQCKLAADELVEAMNRLLSGVTTSQGIRVKLDWKLRDDVPPEAREAVRLLAQPVGALLPEERAALRDALYRLIEVSRGEQPELAYGEHLAAALDYRGWFAFKIRYTRPESQGAWLDLHRRSPLSQGEQKVLCYLPLFAAAAAHFTSLAGAAPHAPRLVLLDDAFPKIDVRTHPLLFGLLVQLDLDFVITSERLWGDHDTVPSLAIYEALRDPNQRGIAQYEYRWDGRQLRALG